MAPRRRGYLVKTKTGRTGVAYHDDPLVNGKKPVHVEGKTKGDPTKILCDPDTLTITGYVD